MKGTDPSFPLGMRFISSSSTEEVQYGWWFWTPSVRVANSEGIRHILMTNPNNYLRDIIGVPKGSLLTTEGEEFIRQRRIIHAALTKEYLQNLQRIITKRCELLIQELNQNLQVECYPFFEQYVNRIIGELTYGTTKEAQDIIEAEKIFGDRSVLSLFYFLLPFVMSYLPLEATKKRNRARDIVDKNVPILIESFRYIEAMLITAVGSEIKRKDYYPPLCWK